MLSFEGNTEMIKQLLLTTLLCTSAHALEISYGAGESKFSNEKDKRRACVLAENKALDDALLKYAGKEFRVESEQFCVDTKEHTYCNYIREIDSSTAGTVSAVVDRIQRSDKDTCYVEVKAEIEKARQLSASVKSKRIYFTGDAIDVTVTTGEPLYLYVFNLHKKGLDILFPNEYNTNNLIDESFAFSSKDYKFTASLDKGDSLSNETLLFLFTKRRQDIDTRDVTKDNLKDVLKSIPNFEKKLVQHNFVIKRSER